MNYHIKIIIAMVIFGSIGLFVRLIPLSSSEIVISRTILGSLVLFFVFVKEKKKITLETLKKNLLILILSGTAMALNWVFLFEAYRHTSISIATIIYYCAPIIVFLLSPLLLKEKITFTKFVGIFLAMLGMILVNKEGITGGTSNLGIFYGLLAAIFYAMLMLCNKFIKNLGGLEITLAQLVVASIILFPYVLINHSGTWELPNKTGIMALLILGIIHTGYACYLYFSSMQKLSGQTVALCSYIDPFSALIFSYFILSEKLSGEQWIGAILILGGAGFGELYKSRKKQKIY